MRAVHVFRFVLALFSVPCWSQTITPRPSEGEDRVTLDTTGFNAGTAIDIYTAKNSADCGANYNSTKLELASGANPTVQGNTSTIILKDKLVQGEIICAVIAGGATPPPQVSVDPPEAPPGFDWGLVRAYFTAGALASQERDQFSHLDLFLAFHLDKTYILPGRVSSKHPTRKSHFEPGMNTFFETRLTSIPVAVQSCTATPANGTAPANPGSACQNAPTTATANPTDTTTAYLNSQKSARLMFGFYTPFLLKPWAVTSKKAGGPDVTINYALFVAPLVKTGFDTTLNGLNQTQQSSSTPSQVQLVGGSNQFYKFYDFGFRLGHYELSNSPSAAHHLLSYVDVGFGRFSNLASLLCPKAQFSGNNTCMLMNTGNATSPVYTPLNYQRDWRLNVEGLLEVPATHGFSVGFSTNVALYRKGAVNAPVHILPADDLRFLFAYKFDISKIAARLAPTL